MSQKYMCMGNQAGPLAFCASMSATLNSSPGCTPRASPTDPNMKEYATISSGAFPSRHSLKSSDVDCTCTWPLVLGQLCIAAGMSANCAAL